MSCIAMHSAFIHKESLTFYLTLPYSRSYGLKANTFFRLISIKLGSVERRLLMDPYGISCGVALAERHRAILK